MPTITINPSRPHAAQRAALEHDARYKVLCWGRRTGKTELFVHALGLGHGVHKAALHGLPVAYFSMTYKNVRELWGRLKAVYAPLIAEKNESLHTMTLHGGGSIECWTMEKAEGARGRAYAGIVVDEAAYTSRLKDKWLLDLQPMLLDYAGWAIFGSTPNGLDDFYTLYSWGEDATKPDWQSFQHSTYANPHMSRSELDKLKASVPSRVWEQEWLAQFLSDGGEVFRNLTACVADENAIATVEGMVVIGVDLGRYNDYTVMTAVDASSGAVLDIDRFTDVAWAIQEQRLKSFARKWNPAVIWIEENFNDKFAEDMRLANLPVRFFRTTAQSKQQIVNALALSFEQSDVRLPHATHNPHAAELLHELRVFTLQRLPSGNFRYTAPDGMHDDMVMSLALAWHGASRYVSNIPLVSFR